MKIRIDGQVYDVEVRPGEVVVDGKAVAARASRRGNEATVEVAGKSRKVELKGETIVVDGKSYSVTVEAPARQAAAAPTAASRPASAPAPATQVAPATGSAPPSPAPAGKVAEPTTGAVMRAPMPGKILRVVAQVGAKVAVGDTLLVLEAMKMENDIRATAAGTVKSLPVAAGSTVNAGEVLAVIE